MNKKQTAEHPLRMIINSKISEGYRAFRRDLICAARLEEQLKEDAVFFDKSGVRDPSSFEVTYAKQAVECAVEAFDNAVRALEYFESIIPTAILDNEKVLKRTIERVVTQEPEALKEALCQVSNSGSARAWFLNLRKELAARRDAFRLGTYLITPEGTSLNDVFKVRNVLVDNSSTSPLSEFATPDGASEPQPFIILCAFGPPGARVVCLVGLAFMIAASNHNVE